MIALAKRRHDGRELYPGVALACDGRPDLAGLPFRHGLDALLNREQAEALNGMSRQLRTTIQMTIRDARDPRPDVDVLHRLLTGESRPGGFGSGAGFHLHGDRTWTTAEAVPCIQQILQAESRDIRRVSVALLQRVAAPEATEALVQWAVFDTDAGNRAAALPALRSRDRHEVIRLLTCALRYPWPRTCEHAAEALVALDGVEAIPLLAAMYTLPNPDAPVRLGLTDPPVTKPKLDPVSPVILDELERHIVATKHLDASSRRTAATALGQFLEHGNVTVRRKASQALAEMGPDAEPAAKALREVLDDPDEDVRCAAAKVLDELAEVAAAKRASEVNRALKELIPELKAREPEDRIKDLLKIGAFGPEAAAAGEHIIEAMSDKVQAVHEAAANTLAHVAPRLHGPVSAILGGTNPRDGIQQLGELGSEAAMAVPLLLRCNANPALWGGGTGKLKDHHEDLFPVIAKIAPMDQRFAAAVLASIATPNPRGDRLLGERRLAGIAQLKVIQATAAEKVAALIAAPTTAWLRSTSSRPCKVLAQTRRSPCRSFRN